MRIVNPYCTRPELIEALKMKPEDVLPGSMIEKELERAIFNGSRWIDRYTRRRYYSDYYWVTPLRIGPHDESIYGDMIFPKINGERLHIANLRDLYEGETLFTDQTDFYFNDNGITRRYSNWLYNTDQGILIRAEFGYDQMVVDVAEKLTGSATSVTDLTLTSTDFAKATGIVYARSIPGSSPLDHQAVTFFETEDLNAAYQLTTAQDLLAPSVAPATMSLTAYAIAQGYTAGTFSLGAFLGTETSSFQLKRKIDNTLVPRNLPSHIGIAAVLVSAALSGHNRKEVAGLDGTKTEILSNKIPETVYEMLGKPMPLV